MKIIQFLLILSSIIVVYGGKDLYKILGIKKNAKDRDIKRGYHKMALKWHPDKNLDNKEEATKRFEEVAYAYEVLSDPEKRKIYDAYGEEGLKPGFGGEQPNEPRHGSNTEGFQHFQSFGTGDTRQQHFGFQGSDPFDLFARMFGGGSGMEGMQFGFGNSGFESRRTNRFGGSDSSHYQTQQSIQDLYADNDSNIRKLSDTKFPDAKSNHVWIVQYYSSTNQATIDFKSHFIKLASILKKNGVSVGLLNCDEKQSFCSKNGITTYPRICLVYAGKHKCIPESENQLTAKFIYEFIKENHPGEVINIRTPSHVMDLLHKNSKGFITLWTTKYDTSLQLKSLAYKYRNSIHIVESRGNNEKLAELFNVTKFPSLTFTCAGKLTKATEMYSGDIHSDLQNNDIDTFISTFKDGKRCKELIKKASSYVKKDKEYARTMLKLSRQELLKKSIGELLKGIEILDITTTGLIEKSDYVDAILRVANTRNSKFDL
jgi:curved DNA-binding protein CbpA